MLKEESFAKGQLEQADGELSGSPADRADVR
jgi:hypothetical protein